MMELNVNGKNIEAEGVSTLAELLERYELTPSNEGVAVAMNGDVVPRSEWVSKALKPGDTIEIIHAVQGG